MTGFSRGRQALSLPGLVPCAESLVALTVDPVPMTHLLAEPAIVLHAVRWSRSNSSWLTAEWFGDPAVLESAANLIAHPSAKQPYFANEIGRQAREIGRVAAALVRTVSHDPHDCVAALLAPLGWYALAASEPQHATPELATSLLRKLVRRWQLPQGLADTLAHLGSEHDVVDEVAEDAKQAHLIRSAVAEAEARVGKLGIVHESAKSTFEKTTHANDWPKGLTPAVSHALLPHLLTTVAKAKRQAGYHVLPRLETENEVLRCALDRVHQDARTTLHDAKLESLAEFAAGAGHEINNPLAVISGHCQRMLNRESDPDKRNTLSTVIRQTMRIHGIVRGLMQFARPPKPHHDVVSVPVIVEDVVGELSDLKADHQVEIQVVTALVDDTLTDPQLVSADAAQVKTILHHVLRNAIEAAGRDGRVRITLESDDQDYRIVVDDSGQAPTDEQREHIFDPFFSGRSAGRGRGLGLSIAWRLARVNGGDVVYAPTADGQTRFIISLPLEATQTLPFRKVG